MFQCSKWNSAWFGLDPEDFLPVGGAPQGLGSQSVGFGVQVCV